MWRQSSLLTRLQVVLAAVVRRCRPRELIGCDFSVYPNIKRWLENMKKLKSWNQVNEVFNGFVAANKGKEFVRV